MNAKQLMMTVAMCVSTGFVFAQAREAVSPAAGFVGSKSRAEVKAEVAQARSEGTLIVKDDTYPIVNQQMGNRSRAEVRAEMIQPMKKDKYTSDLYVG
jgi:hypothetical protein